jgi:hypothetical protein
MLAEVVERVEYPGLDLSHLYGYAFLATVGG